MNNSNQLIGHNVIQAILESPVVKDKGVVAMPKDGAMGLIEPERVDPFFILDIAMVTSLMERWVRVMPDIPPYYAVKCNPDPSLVSIMATLGANFDCASKAEIELVLSLGVSPNRIIFVNPCKPESHIQYAKSVGVNLVTYDSIFENEKMKRLYPECGLVLRLKVPDEGAKAPLGSKYGALPCEIEPLLQAAKLAQLPVVGISFHVGSGSDNPETYKAGIAAAKAAFEAAVQLGLPKLHLLDIGGGFTSGPHFETAAEAVKSALKLHFSNEPGLTVIAEPGRYFAESVMTLAANIIGKRVREELKEYWIADGLYGSMNCIMYDNAKLSPSPLAATSDPWNPTCQGKERYFSTVFGPTCDALDTLVTDYSLPELEIGDWLVFEKMGAYTSAASSSFNGFLSSDIRILLVCSGLGGTTSFDGEGADFEAVGMKEKVNGIFEVQPHKKSIDVA